MPAFENLKRWQKAVVICFFSVTPAIVLICLGTVWVSDPLLTSRLVLILIAFSAAASGMIYLSNKTIEGIKADRLPDGESRIDSVIIGTILVLVVLTGGLIEMAGLTSFSKGGFTASCTGLLASLASLVSGVFIGFLFGVPRSVAAPAANQIPAIARRPPPPGGRAQAPAAAQAQPQPGDQAQAPAAAQAQPQPDGQAQAPVADQAQPPPGNQAQAPVADQAQPPAGDQPQAPAADQGQVPGAARGVTAAGRAPYEANTNLTQISDWITKTIVGVGLVNWQRERDWFNSTAEALGTGLHIGPSGFTIGGSIIVFFGVSGFLCGYNLTQLFLARALAGADSASDKPR